ncbi:takeout-like [Asbolus verrucosus]|uniref:Takeout-like n=1 Tax=Asbolus verrucosus TaxID=1661398 RepID=A0A482VGY5_ASBVE|nr:takeout-like [Asbolus verrucosus]
MTTFTALIHLFFLINLSFCAKLPSSFKKCNRKTSDFNLCLPEAVESAVSQLNKPINEVGLPSLEPLQIPSLTIGAGTNAVGVEQNFKNVKLSGFTKIAVSKFDFNLANNTIIMESLLAQLTLRADYDVSGKILLLPVYGAGPATVILEKLRALHRFSLEEYEKKNQKHYRVVENKISLEPQLVKFNFENLFNGDQALGDSLNRVLNENWKEVFADVKTNYEEAFQQIISGVFNNLLARVAVTDLFIDE